MLRHSLVQESPEVSQCPTVHGESPTFIPVTPYLSVISEFSRGTSGYGARLSAPRIG